jgi:hypothetical protein
MNNTDAKNAPFKPGFRVDIRSPEGELLAWSPIYYGPDWADMDDATAEAEVFVELLNQRGISCDYTIAVMVSRQH